jgi:hypothetical protein
MKTYIEFFAIRDDAYRHMLDRNRSRSAESRQPGAECFTLYCLIDGPEDNFAVVDLATAVDMGVAYEWNI